MVICCQWSRILLSALLGQKSAFAFEPLVEREKKNNNKANNLRKYFHGTSKNTPICISHWTARVMQPDLKPTSCAALHALTPAPPWPSAFSWEPSTHDKCRAACCSCTHGEMQCSRTQWSPLLPKACRALGFPYKYMGHLKCSPQGKVLLHLGTEFF